MKIILDGASDEYIQIETPNGLISISLKKRTAGIHETIVTVTPRRFNESGALHQNFSQDNGVTVKEMHQVTVKG